MALARRMAGLSIHEVVMNRKRAERNLRFQLELIEKERRA